MLPFAPQGHPLRHRQRAPHLIPPRRQEHHPAGALQFINARLDRFGAVGLTGGVGTVLHSAAVVDNGFLGGQSLGGGGQLHRSGDRTLPGDVHHLHLRQGHGETTDVVIQAVDIQPKPVDRAQIHLPVVGGQIGKGKGESVFAELQLLPHQQPPAVLFAIVVRRAQLRLSAGKPLFIRSIVFGCGQLHGHFQPQIFRFVGGQIHPGGRIGSVGIAPIGAERTVLFRRVGEGKGFFRRRKPHQHRRRSCLRRQRAA